MSEREQAEPVRFVIVSPATWGRMMLDAVRESPRLTLAGVWSRRAENAADVARTYGGTVYSTYEAALADPAVEAVVLPTPHFLHYPQAAAALEAGKHVFVEKPIANHVPEALRLQAASEARGLVLGVGLQGRRTGGARAAKRLLESGELGQVAQAVVVHGSPHAPGYTASDWETSAELMPGGILDQLGVHYVEILQYLLGPIKRVAGFYAAHVSPFPIPDAGAAAYEFASGVVGTHATHQVSAYVSSLSLFTTRGVLHVHRMGRELQWQEVVDLQRAKAAAPALETIPCEGPDPNSGALREELEDFAACVRHGGQPEVGAREGISTLRVVRAVMESHASGRAVDIPVDDAPPPRREHPAAGTPPPSR